MPPNGCRGTDFARTFQAVTGFAPPTTDTETDPVYRLFLDFQARKIEETFDYWQKQVKEKYPSKVFLVSTTFVPTLVNRRMTTRLASLADSSKSEYRLALFPGLNLLVFERDLSLARPEDDIRMALGWTLLRDAADGRPPHVWAPGFPNQDHTLAFAASVLTYGAIANVDAWEENLLTAADPPGTTPRAALRAAFALGDKVSLHLAHVRPLRWAAVHFSEEARNRRGGDHSLAWREVLWPVTGAYGVLVRLGLPVGLVNDFQLAAGELDGYRLLFLSGFEDLSRAQKREVRKFLARGGKVVVNRPEWKWSDPLGNDGAAAAFREVVERTQKAVPTKVQVVGGVERMHSVAYRGKGENKLVVAVTNDFSWVQTQTVLNIPDVVNPAPPSVNGATVIVRSHRLPARVKEVMTGISPRVMPVHRGFKVMLPEFRTLSVLVMEWD